MANAMAKEEAYVQILRHPDCATVLFDWMFNSVDEYPGDLASARGYGPENIEMLTEISKEAENFRKLAYLESAGREQVEKELIAMTKQVQELQQKTEQRMQDVEILHEKNINDLKELLQKEKNDNDNLRQMIQQLETRNSSLIMENEEKNEEILKLQSNISPYSEFTLQELKRATGNFTNKLGEGGFGCVYKGNLHGITVAIKKLKTENIQGVLQFDQEVAILTRVRHPNLVTLMGACSEVSALVYEFLPNDSLEKHLNTAKKGTPLTWIVRTRIISEICLALVFLHSNKPSLVIHGDLKPDNILLDANFVSKLGDFGISRIINNPGTGATPLYLTSNPIGTKGYIDPEFITTGELTAKSDVYSFGIVILRLLTGKPAMNIASVVRETVQTNKMFRKTIDPSVKDWPIDHARELAILGLRCAQMYKSDRPDLFYEVWPIVERLQRHP